jgi:hypothetical protein
MEVWSLRRKCAFVAHVLAKFSEVFGGSLISVCIPRNATSLRIGLDYFEIQNYAS